MALKSGCSRRGVLPVSMRRPSHRRLIEVRGFKWPRRPTAMAITTLLGEDAFGRWLGVRAVDPVVDVDIVLPVHWSDDVLEEVDLELDILCSAGGSVHVRDREAFDRVREVWAMPDDIAAQAEATCQQIRTLVEQGAEPFGTVGRAWLSRFE